MTLKPLNSTPFLIQAACALVLLLPINAWPTPFGSYDARAIAMGNTGVAAANPSAAIFYNPALLALQENNTKQFHLTLPTLALNINDQQNLIDDLKNYQAAPSNSLQRTEIAKQMLNKPFFAEAQLGAAMVFKAKSYSLALNYSRHVSASLKTSANDLVTHLDTELNVIGLDSQELGFTLAKSFRNNQNHFSVGINPKLVSASPFSNSTSATRVNANTLDFINLNKGQNRRSFISFDLGFAYQRGPHFRAGFSLRDLISQRYTSIEGKRIYSTPKARIGVAYTDSFYILTADYDLSKNSPIAFESAQRFFSLGTELRLHKTTKVRLGYQHNSADSSNPVQIFSLGAGLTLFGTSLDLSISSNQKKTLSAAVQTGFSF